MSDEFRLQQGDVQSREHSAPAPSWEVFPAESKDLFNSILQDVQCSNFGNGLRAAPHVELATDIEDVFFRRVDADDQLIGDLSVGRAIYEQPQHLALTYGQ